jgi:hypothetical protein
MEAISTVCWWLKFVLEQEEEEGHGILSWKIWARLADFTLSHSLTSFLSRSS